MGIWNKIFDTTKVNFAKLAEEPHMSRSEQAGFMNARIAQLEQVIVTKSGALVTLKCKYKECKTHLANLNAYMRSLIAKRFGKLTKEVKEAQRDVKKVERELCTLEAEIKQTKAKIAKEVKELKGPISVAIRNALREIGIELTIYWAGTFVGSQIAKLADWDRYKILLEAIEWTLATLNLTDNERMKCNTLMAETKTVWNLFSMFTKD